MSELVLFFSDRCEYSREVISFIKSNSLDSFFIFVNIDNTSVKLPSFVEAVPLIFNKEKTKIYLEDEIDELLKELKGRAKISSVMSASDQLKGVTDKFSFIVDDNENSAMNSRGYNMLNNSSGDLLTPQLTSSEGGSKFDEKHYNNYLSQRDNDIASLFPRQNNVR